MSLGHNAVSIVSGLAGNKEQVANAITQNRANRLKQLPEADRLTPLKDGVTPLMLALLLGYSQLLRLLTADASVCPAAVERLSIAPEAPEGEHECPQFARDDGGRGILSYAINSGDKRTVELALQLFNVSDAGKSFPRMDMKSTLLYYAIMLNKAVAIPLVATYGTWGAAIHGSIDDDSLVLTWNPILLAASHAPELVSSVIKTTDGFDLATPCFAVTAMSDSVFDAEELLESFTHLLALAKHSPDAIYTGTAVTCMGRMDRLEDRLTAVFRFTAATFADSSQYVDDVWNAVSMGELDSLALPSLVYALSDVSLLALLTAAPVSVSKSGAAKAYFLAAAAKLHCESAAKHVRAWELGSSEQTEFESNSERYLSSIRDDFVAFRILHPNLIELDISEDELAQACMERISVVHARLVLREMTRTGRLDLVAPCMSHFLNVDKQRSLVEELESATERTMQLTRYALQLLPHPPIRVLVDALREAYVSADPSGAFKLVLDSMVQSGYLEKTVVDFKELDNDDQLRLLSLAMNLNVVPAMNAFCPYVSNINAKFTVPRQHEPRKLLLHLLVFHHDTVSALLQNGYKLDLDDMGEVVDTSYKDANDVRDLITAWRKQRVTPDDVFVIVKRLLQTLYSLTISSRNIQESSFAHRSQLRRIAEPLCRDMQFSCDNDDLVSTMCAFPSESESRVEAFLPCCSTVNPLAIVHGAFAGLSVRQLIEIKRLGGDENAIHDMFGNALSTLLLYPKLRRLLAEKDTLILNMYLPQMVHRDPDVIPSTRKSSIFVWLMQQHVSTQVVPVIVGEKVKDLAEFKRLEQETQRIRSLIEAISQDNVALVESIINDDDTKWLTTDTLEMQRTVYAFAKSDAMRHVLGPRMRQFYKLLEPENKFKPNDKCPICLEKVNDSNNGLVVIPSMKVYHKQCIETWLRESDTDPITKEKVTAVFQFEYPVVSESVSSQMGHSEARSSDLE